MKNYFNLLVILLFSLYSNAQITNGLIGYFPFTDGSCADYASAGITTVYGGGGTVPDECGHMNAAWKSSVWFFNSNHLFDFGTTQSFSLVSSFRTSSSGNFYIMHTSYSSLDTSGWSLGFEHYHGSKLEFRLNGTRGVFFSTVDSFNDNLWHQAVVVVDRASNTAKLFVDAVQQNIGHNFGAGTVLNNNTLQLDSTNCNATAPFSQLIRLGDGAIIIDETRFYNRALTFSEIQTLNNLRVVYHSPLIVSFGQPANGEYYFYSAIDTPAIPIWTCTNNGHIRYIDPWHVYIGWDTIGNETVYLTCVPMNVGCISDTDSRTIYISSVYSSIEDLDGSEWVQVSPNPTQEYLNLKANETEIEQLLVYDINGKQVCKFENPSHKVDVSFLSSGMYFSDIKSKGKTQRNRWIKL